MTFKWIRCSEKLPDTPKHPCEEKEYMVVYGFPGYYCYQYMSYADGWNCRVNTDGSITKTHEVHNIIAWAEVPEYTELEELEEVLFDGGEVTEQTDISIDGLEVANV